ncbi:MAG: tyrosine-type recombinase/integrase [Verrucomicrobiota bacterium]
METFASKVERWRLQRSLSAAPTTRHFHVEIVKIILDHWPRRDQPVAEISIDDVLAFAEKVAHYCPSRWNAVVGVLRFVTPHGRELKRRKLKLTRQAPPNQLEFARLLAEADRLKRSKAGLVIAFLANTGLRITAAQNVKWSDVHENRIEYVAKGGRRCSVPIFESLRPVLSRLRTVTGETDFVLPRGHIRRGLAKACARAGLRPLNHHDFRHLFTTRCVESGVDLPTLSRWRGDADGGAMLSKRYFHLLDSHSYAMAGRVRIGLAA